jgi:hypothetical protein
MYGGEIAYGENSKNRRVWTGIWQRRNAAGIRRKQKHGGKTATRGIMALRHGGMAKQTAACISAPCSGDRAYQHAAAGKRGTARYRRGGGYGGGITLAAASWRWTARCGFCGARKHRRCARKGDRGESGAALIKQQHRAYFARSIRANDIGDGGCRVFAASAERALACACVRRINIKQRGARGVNAQRWRRSKIGRCLRQTNVGIRRAKRRARQLASMLWLIAVRAANARRQNQKSRGGVA